MKALWYKKPALNWAEGLPVGNGRLGAMIYGVAGHEVIQLNEESVWSSAFKKRNNGDARKAIPVIRKLLREERVEEAQELVFQTMTGVPAEQSWFQSAGELHIDYFTEQTRGLSGSLTGSQEAFKDPAVYHRELDLETGIVSTSFSEDNTLPSTQDFSRNSKGSSVSYTREVFASATMDVLVIHISASIPKSIYFRANFEAGNCEMVTASRMRNISEDTIAMQQDAGVPFAALCTAVASGGSVSTKGGYLVVEGADEVTLYVDVESAYEKGHYRRKKGQSSIGSSRYAFWAENRALEKVCFASSAASYDDVRSSHINEFSGLFNKVNFALTAEGVEDLKSKKSAQEKVNNALMGIFDDGDESAVSDGEEASASGDATASSGASGSVSDSATAGASTAAATASDFASASASASSPESKCPTDELLSKYGVTNYVAELYWHWCRYLFISAGGKCGRLPIPGCGIWNEGNAPTSLNRYDMKGGLEMSYLGACMTGLGSLEKNLFDFLGRSYKNGVNTAHEMYGVDGYVIHSSLDIWGDTAPSGKNLMESISPMGAARIATLVRDYYEYTMDKKFLKKNFYLMKRACDFYAEYMVPSLDGKNLILNPSVCPDSCYSLANGERAAVAAGCDVDNRILEKLIKDTLKSAEDLGLNQKNTDLASYKALLSKLEGIQVGTDKGKKIIRKWPFKCEKVFGGEFAPSLYAVYPGKNITYGGDAELMELARNTIDTSFAERKDRSLYGETMYMNFMASIHDSAEAGASVKAVIASNGAGLVSCKNNIDVSANLGAMLGMTRMVVQSEVVNDVVEISLLPCLLADWSDGAVSGVVLKGNLRLDMEWCKETLVKADLYTKTDSQFCENIAILYKDHRYEARLVDGRIDLLNVLPSTI